MIIGIHTDDILKRTNKYNLLQIFITRKKLDTKKIKDHLMNNKILLVVHSNYKNNIAENWDESSWWIKNIIREIKITHELGGRYLVLHLGKRKNILLETAYNNMYSSLIYILNSTKKYDSVTILLETPSGQGTELCYRLDDLGYFFNKLKNYNRIKICIDTCHIYAAGYDISNRSGFDDYLKKFDNLIGLDNFKLLHFNDSKYKLGSLKDRHENIGDGCIGLAGLLNFYDYCKKNKIPIVLETPDESFLNS
jgi:deoxyribonuclease-4